MPSVDGSGSGDIEEDTDDVIAVKTASGLLVDDEDAFMNDEPGSGEGMEEKGSGSSADAERRRRRKRAPQDYDYEGILSFLVA